MLYYASTVHTSLICSWRLHPPTPSSYVGPHILRMLKPFVEHGWLDIAYGGRETGEYLTS